MRLPAATITVVSSDEEFDDSLRDTSKTGLGLMGVSKMMVRDDKIEGRSSSKVGLGMCIIGCPCMLGVFLVA